jgi:hypothetical protein
MRIAQTNRIMLPANAQGIKVKILNAKDAKDREGRRFDSLTTHCAAGSDGNEKWPDAPSPPAPARIKSQFADYYIFFLAFLCEPLRPLRSWI